MTVTTENIATGTWAWIKPLTTLPLDWPADQALAIRDGDRWIAVRPLPMDREHGHNRDGWRLEQGLTNGQIEHLGLRDLVDSHTGWFIREAEVRSPITSPVTTDPAATDQATLDELHRMMADLRRELDRAIERADANEQALEDFKTKVVEVSREYAERNDMCSVYDECMEELGLPRREQDFEVEVQVTYRQYVTVKAQDLEQAQEKVADMTTDSWWAPGSPIADQVESYNSAEYVEVEVV